MAPALAGRFFFSKVILFICFVLGLHCCTDFSLVVVCGLLTGGCSCGARALGHPGFSSSSMWPH